MCSTFEALYDVNFNVHQIFHDDKIVFLCPVLLHSALKSLYHPSNAFPPMDPLDISQISDFDSIVKLPTPNSIVYREECTQCFDSQDSPLGIDICLACFNGGCVELDHAAIHVRKTGHSLALNIRRVRQIDPKTRSPSAEPPMKKLAISEQVDTDQFDTKTSLVLYTPDHQRKLFPLPQPLPPKIDNAIVGILASSTSAQASEVKAWEEEIETCAHVTELKQDSNPAPAVQASATCHACELSSNLWLCLQCGSLGCGRPQFGGVGGNGHALQHFHSTGHCVNVKLGTITAEGSADLYCYQCDDARTDNRLQEHLAHFSIEIAKQEKTEKSMTELQVEHNMKFDFSMSGEGARDLLPVQGPGLTGLKNLGNSCYLASVLQVLFALPPFQTKFYTMFNGHSATCEAVKPAECFDCQMNKIAHGLLSGRYALSAHSSRSDSFSNDHDPETSSLTMFQEGIKPMMFKTLVGKGHPEFSTMRQQDADEFMRYLFQFIQRQIYQQRQSATQSSPNITPGKILEDPTLPFRFELEQKLQCTSCKCVRYRYEEQDVLSIPVPAIPIGQPSESDILSPNLCQQTYEPVSLEECLKSFTTPQVVEYNCPRCKSPMRALTTSRFGSFPKYLLVHARRFAVVNWVPKKLEIPVIIKGHEVDFGKYFGSGPQPEEELLPENEAVSESTVNAETLAILESMGFPSSKCRKAILETGDCGAESAMNWLFEHANDIEETASTQNSHNEADVTALEDMGFTANQAKKALTETGGNIERAVEWLFSHPDDDGSIVPCSAIDQKEENGIDKASPKFGDRELPARFRLKAFISHKGPSVHSGHYVAHVAHDLSDGDLPQREWILFNDEKVAKAPQGELSAQSLAPLAYIYLFERTNTSER
ncbi:hypothetical protein O181_006377 [Austropuccinia psidii MF-1]|uniref:Ubiquitin carboxyl-terminal hydrolase n=1 Tax=Austropuccinia psidii MF-1 TaxID=1389203 RepID=A0A9Q3GHJ7_9BASI|nr:hypothetical protein [Austropuccinia psidii MF-1]